MIEDKVGPKSNGGALHPVLPRDTLRVSEHNG